MGLLIDRFGLNLIASLAVGAWSCAGIATGFTHGLAGLMGVRTALGMAESAGIPAAGKAIDQFLKPAERAIGNAMNQAGVSLGLIAAPPLAIWIAGQYGWRYAFLATGVLGLAWIPLWNFVARLSPPAPAAKANLGDSTALLRDPRLWAFVAANALTMFGYSLWSNWSTFYFTDVQGLSLAMTSRYVVAAFTFAAAGGFAGGWLSARQIARGIAPPTAAASRVHRGRRAFAGHRRDSRGAHPSLGRRCHLAEFLRGIRDERECILAAARYLRPPARRVQHRCAGGFIRSHASGRLARNRPHDRCAPLGAHYVGCDDDACARLRCPVDREAARMKQHLKRWFFRLLGKDPEAVVVSFVTGDAALCARMIEEVRALVPDRRHFVATPENWPELRRQLRGYRIGLAPVMLMREGNALRRAAYRLAPRKILAYNSRMERHHLAA